MPADGVLAEALARIEYKVDLILWIVMRVPGVSPLLAGMLPQLASALTCPACTQQVQHTIDIGSNVVIRKCGCKTGIVPGPNLEAFAPPPATGGRAREQRTEEDRDDSPAGRGRGR